MEHTVNALRAEWHALDAELEVVRWRTLRLLNIGYELGEAAGVAGSRIDIHELERLIGAGCPLRTAVRIVA